MCRHLVYVGPPITLSALFLEPPHSLLHQSWAPKFQHSGVVNADGFGVGWYDHRRRVEPARYRDARPMWHDASFASIAGLIDTTAALGAVRSATPGFPVEDSGAAPFTADQWLFSHNGRIEGSHDSIGEKLRSEISPRRAAGILGATDSEVLFAMVLDRLDAGGSPGDALTDAIERAAALTSGYWNTVLTDGYSIAAFTGGNTHFVLERDGATIVASEPFDDDPTWQPLPDGLYERKANP